MNNAEPVPLYTSGDARASPTQSNRVNAAENLRLNADINYIVELSLDSEVVIQHTLNTELVHEEAKISRLHKSWGYKKLRRCKDAYIIDQVACIPLSDIIRERQLSVEDAVRFIRGETASDTRPNKAIDPNRLLQVFHGYSHVEALVKIATHGVEAQWSSTPPTRRPSPRNHGSCRRNIRAVTKNICENQDCGYPLGAVEKKGIDPTIDVRTIHDLSYLQDSVPTIINEPITKIARSIEYLANNGDASRIRILKGDVRGVYKHLRTTASQELNILLIDFAEPFGWTGPPPCYFLFGRAISWLMSTNSPASVSNPHDKECYFGYGWVDILVEPDIGNRLHCAESTLRDAMLAVLGP
ncbi:Hypothetical protein PHPALM_36999 [Phytophthora palmivora]|uniref:Reverse transcriptase n=1 Tax=Phytophthora palmivora TaxID=4796 RepID=A0A2P4WYH7_9STRA|nr:Hypothetical protein PHPALM_36999 [Phytophthora palmivora]